MLKQQTQKLTGEFLDTPETLTLNLLEKPKHNTTLTNSPLKTNTHQKAPTTITATKTQSTTTLLTPMTQALDKKLAM